MKSRNIAFFAVFTALALILSYIETLIPVFIAVPGVKLGLGNLAVLFALYKLGAPKAALLSFLKVVLTSLMFGNAYSFAYSLAGAVLSFLVAFILWKSGRFSETGVSIAGAVAHNIGQIIVAAAVLETYGIVSYFPVLLISGVITGTLIGVVSAVLIKRIRI